MSKNSRRFRSYDPVQSIADRFRSGQSKDRLVTSNERDVLRLIRSKPGLARSEMTAQLDLTQQSIHRIVDALVSRGLCRLEDPKPGTGRGQPSPTVFLNPSYAVSAGIAVDTDTITVALFDFSGAVLSTEEVGNINRSLEEGQSQIARSVQDQLNQLNLDRDVLFGAGVAISGFLEEGTTYNTPLPLREWSLVELGPLIERTLDCPVWVGNIANAAATCETMLGFGRHIDSFAYFAFSFGFGGAIIINGELWRGRHGNAGELSAMFTPDEMSRRPALEHLLAMLKNNGLSINTVHEMRGNFDLSWPGVAEWIDLVMPALNRVVNAVYATLDPEAIVFGGEIPKRLAEELIRRVSFVRGPRHGRLMKTPRLLSTNLDINAAAVGAAAMPFKAIYF